jgi:hypothetical protein
MLRYWDPDKILHRDDDLIILSGLSGTQQYSYFVRLEKANVEIEIRLETLNKELLNDKAVEKLEKHIFGAMEEMQVELENAEAPPQQWKNRTK